ncbi:MAG: ferritin-like domain-containing protein [Myxococcota bacterium]
MRPKLRIRPGNLLAAEIRANRAIPLGRYLQGLAHASALASLLTLSACGDSPSNVDDPPPEDPPPDPPATVDPPRRPSPERPRTPRVPDPLTEWISPEQAILPECDGYTWGVPDRINPAITDWDYLAVTACDYFSCPGTFEVGTPCRTEEDAASCQEQVEGVKNGSPPRLITTRGAEVTTYVGEEALLEFLGPVDTPQEAMLVAFFDWFSVRCNDPSVGAVRLAADGYDVVATKITAECDPIIETRYLLHVGSDGQITELDSEAYSVEFGLCIGRRPEGLHERVRSSDERSPGTHFANIATLEAAAVTAFERLAADLTDLGAPRELVDDARAAARDEARHASIMGTVARHFGTEPEPPSIAPPESRDTFAIALENAVEGCVRETFGALAGCYQGLRASDPVVAAAMRSVSEDEVRHADLSHRVDAFLQTRLTPAERARLAEAKRDAILGLRRELDAPRSPGLATVAGHPPPEIASTWIHQLERDVWQTGA